MQPRPVSKACPACGEAGFRPVKPSKWIAFSSDRKCTGCATVYTPPTPVWAALVFLLIGLTMLVAGGASAVASLVRPTMDPPAPLNPIGVLTSGGVAVVGVLAVIHGARVLLRPGKV